jgi:hypothetical protein
MSSSNDTQKEKKGLDNQDDKRNTRKEHLEEDAHGSMYDTASPQESEDTRRLQ